MVVIFLDDEGRVCVVTPTPEALAQHGIKAVAVKDVPAGKPFKIIPASDVPTTEEGWRDWVVNPSELTDGIGGESSMFPAPKQPPSEEDQQQ